MTQRALATLAEDRSRGYWLLSSLWLTRPDPGFIDSLRARLDVAAKSVEDASPSFSALASATRLAEADPLAVEYTRLFGGLARDYGPPPPFESVHRGSQPMGDVTLGVLRAYRQAGFGEIRPEAGPQDHIGVELEFLSLLCHDEAEAWKAGDTATALSRVKIERDFLDQHLLCWAPKYCEHVARESRAPFYAALARLTAEVLTESRALLAEIREAAPKATGTSPATAHPPA